MDLAIVAESARWGDYRRDVHSWSSGPYELYTKGDYYDIEQARLINDYFPDRSEEVMNQYRNSGLYPDTEAPVFKIDKRRQHGGLFRAGNPLIISAGAVAYYTTDGSDPRLAGGGVSHSATQYTDPITLNETVLVKARAYEAGQWSALTEAVFVLDAPCTLRVTEIMYHPTLGEDTSGYTNSIPFEFIELQNIGHETIGLAGIKFADGITFDFTTGDVTSLQPGECVVVVSSLAAFADRYANWQDINIAGEYEGALDNQGERVEVQDWLSRSIQSFTYDGEWYWAADRNGFSLVPINPDGACNPDTKEFWRVSAYRHGSPGEADPQPTTPEILVNEALTHAGFLQVNMIELHNPAATDVDLGGWWLTDDANEPQKFMLPPDTIIGEYLTLLEDNDAFAESPLSPESFGDEFALSARGGGVYLYSPDMRYRHGFTFGAAEKGMSFGRYVTSTGEEHFPAQSTSTFGAANAGPRISPVVIGEIMYHPADSGDEFLELVNISGSTVQFYQPDHRSNTWRLAGIGFTFPENVELAAGGRLLLVRDTIATSEFRVTYNVPANVEIFSYSGALDNAGERISLQKPDEPDESGIPYIVVDEVEYDDVAPWPRQADGFGLSLERIALNAYGDDVVNWKASSTPGGTPGGDWSTLDADGDGMPNGWETDNGLDPLTPDGDGDADADRLDNLGEYLNRTDPNDPDTDKDGLSDGDEVLAGTDPLDEASSFTVVDVSRDGEGASIQWTSIPGREYAVYESGDLVNWSLLDVVIADGYITTLLDLDSVFSLVRFYRIEVLPLP